MTVKLVTSIAEAEEVVSQYLDAEVIAFDTETTGLQVRSGHHDYGRTVQFSLRPWSDAVVFEMTDRYRSYIDRIFAQAPQVVAHNLKFDVHVMETFLGWRSWDVRPPRRHHDTVWVARLHDERDKARLKALAVKYLQDDAADEQTKLKRLMTKHDWTWATVPIKHLIEYGGNDAIITGKLFDLLYPRITYSADAYAREQDLAPVLYRMERSGLLVDEDLLDTVISEESEKVEAALFKLQEAAPGVNFNSSIQLKGLLRDLGHDIDNTQAETLKRILFNTGDEFIASLLAYRKAAKTLSTYASPWKELLTPEGRLHPSFNSLGAQTGRMSSDHPNFQNVTRGHTLRDVFTAAEDSKMVVADWDQMELRLYSHFATDENMRAAFISGDDIYLQVADLLGVPRPVGKMLMLASIYGAGPRTIKRQALKMAYDFNLEHLIPEIEAYDWKALYQRFHNSYAIKDLARLCELSARRRGMFGDPYIRTLGGRRQRPKLITLPAVNGHRQIVPTYKDLANSLVQGSSADLMKQALIETDQAGLGDYMRLTVHDEQVLEVPDAEVDDARATLEKIMTRDEFVPRLTVNADAAQRYGDAK